MTYQYATFLLHSNLKSQKISDLKTLLHLLFRLWENLTFSECVIFNMSDLASVILIVVKCCPGNVGVYAYICCSFYVPIYSVALPIRSVPVSVSLVLSFKLIVNKYIKISIYNNLFALFCFYLWLHKLKQATCSSKFVSPEARVSSSTHFIGIIVYFVIKKKEPLILHLFRSM